MRSSKKLPTFERKEQKTIHFMFLIINFANYFSKKEVKVKKTKTKITTIL